jgi:hypothetical protein
VNSNCLIQEFVSPGELLLVAINETDERIEFTSSPLVSQLNHPINFLDLKIEWVRSGNNKRLKFSLFDKPTNKHIYTDPSTFYPPNYVYGWIQGKNIRYIRNNDDAKMYRGALQKFMEFLRQRAYPERIIQQKLSLNKYEDRSNLLRGDKSHKKRNLVQGNNLELEQSNTDWVFVPLANDSARPLVADSLRNSVRLFQLTSKEETCKFLFPVRRGRSIQSVLAKALKY